MINTMIVVVVVMIMFIYFQHIISCNGWSHDENILCHVFTK